jgi:hypothetical protein
VIIPLAEAYSSQGTEIDQHPITLHFDDLPIHLAQGVGECLATFGLARMGHPASSPDLTPYDVFLFSHFKQMLCDRHFEEFQDLSQAVKKILNAMPRDMIDKVFDQWARIL